MQQSTYQSLAKYENGYTVYAVFGIWSAQYSLTYDCCPELTLSLLMKHSSDPPPLAIGTRLMKESITMKVVIRYEMYKTILSKNS